MAGAGNKLRQRLVLASGHPHLAGLAVAALGKFVDHSLEIRRGVVPRPCAVASAIFLDVADARRADGLVLKGADVDTAALAGVAVKVNIAE